MKSTKISKKLNVSRETIVNLDSMNQIMGGARKTDLLMTCTCATKLLQYCSQATICGC